MAILTNCSHISITTASHQLPPLFSFHQNLHHIINTAMSQRSGRRQQPFRFWFPYWNTPAPAPRPTAPTPQRAVSRGPTSAPSQPPTRPQQQPQSPPSPPQSAAARRAAKSPSPSPSSSSPSPSSPSPSSSSPSPSASPLPSQRSSRSQPADQRARQPPSPSRPADQSPPSPPQSAAARRAAKSPSPSPSSSSPSPSSPSPSSSSPSPSASPLPSQRSSRSQPADQRARQPPSPSRPAAKPSSPSREASQPKEAPAATQLDSEAQTATPQGAPKLQPAIKERSQLPSGTLLPDSVPESKTQPSSLEKIPQTILQPETQTPEQIRTKPAPEPAEAATNLKLKLETEPTSASSSQKDVTTQPSAAKAPTPPETPKPENQPNEIQEEKPKPNSKTSENQKLDEKPEEIPKERMKPESELIQDTGTSEQQKLDEKPKSFPGDRIKPDLKTNQDIQTSQEPKLDEKPKEITEEKTKPEPEREQERKITKTLKSGRTPEESKDDKPHTKPEAHTNHHSSESEDELSIMVADAEPIGPHSNTGKLMSDTRTREPKELNEEEKVNGKEHKAIRKVSKVSISSVPWASSCDDERSNFQKEIREGLSRLVQKLSIDHSGRAGSDQGVTIITLAGKNKGATMFIGNEGTTQHSPEKHKKADSGTTSDGERSKDTPKNDTPIAASVNSNVQSINNSVMNDSECKEGNPGVHLVVSTKPTEPVSLKEKVEPPKTQKTASSLTTPQKLTYEPHIRRRCLRGLLLEPSDDDLEDPQKPRRHGCRFSCDDKKKEKEGSGEGTSKTNNGD